MYIIVYDKPIEVTKQKYNILMSNFEGVIAGTELNGKYYIKVWLMKYANLIQQILNN